MTTRRKKNPRSASMEGTLGYLKHRLGGLDSLIPRNRDEWLTTALRLVKGEASHVFRYLADSKSQSLSELGAQIAMNDRIKIQQEVQYWRALAGLIDASNVVMPPDDVQDVPPDDDNEPLDG
jgi:hypothetical protein